jgi:3-deoxy-D-manno-octulosonic-acid transferase
MSPSPAGRDACRHPIPENFVVARRDFFDTDCSTGFKMLWLYRLLFIPALIVLAPRYLLRMRKRGGYGENFGQRFGAHPRLGPKAPGRPRIWLQAVSVGEMLAIGPILEALHRDGTEVYLTTTTSTGYRLARERYSKWTSGIGYFPIDGWPFVARAWRRIDPDLVILTEGERWPELLHRAARCGTPVLCVNARLSDRSFARMKKSSGAARLMLDGITRVLPGSPEDEARFLELGVPRERVTTTGNIKLDVDIPQLSVVELAELRRAVGLTEDPVLLGSSTWPGEEAALVAAMQRARAAGLRCSLLIVPRHAERRSEMERELAASGLQFHFRSRGAASVSVDVAIADTTGELRRLTQLADVVFVGKSLPPHTEGQTPVEAAVLRKPILFGPGMSNFRPIARDLLARGAAEEVRSVPDLAEKVEKLLREPAERTRRAEAAGRWRADNVGAVNRTLAVIRQELSQLKRGQDRSDLK